MAANASPPIIDDDEDDCVACMEATEKYTVNDLKHMLKRDIIQAVVELQHENDDILRQLDSISLALDEADDQRDELREEIEGLKGVIERLQDQLDEAKADNKVAEDILRQMDE